MSDEARTFYRTDAITGETTERVVHTPADEVRAKFDGFRGETKSGKKAADKAAGDKAASAETAK